MAKFALLLSFFVGLNAQAMISRRVLHTLTNPHQICRRAPLLHQTTRFIKNFALDPNGFKQTDSEYYLPPFSDEPMQIVIEGHSEFSFEDAVQEALMKAKIFYSDQLCIQPGTITESYQAGDAYEVNGDAARQCFCIKATFVPIPDKASGF